MLATALGGFKSLGDLRVNPFGLPSQWEWTNYWEILVSGRYWQLMGNSLIIAVLTVILTVAAAAMAAFVFVHVRFFGATFLLNYLLLGLMFPAATAILPLFIKIRDLGLLDTYWGVVLPQVAFGLAMSILLFRNSFRQMPKDLFEAALIDGCGYFRFFWHVILPLSRPILATVGGDRLRPQLEQLSSAAGRAEPRHPLSVAARHHGLSGRVLHGLAPRPGLHHADDPAGDHHVLRGTEAHRCGIDGRIGQRVKV